eukprot:NODE_827_length_3873_cov_0.542925.p1 type:complete len:322 gc:universal NODE_827_length_3873_cov_0.542925:1782-2747(+)
MLQKLEILRKLDKQTIHIPCQSMESEDILRMDQYFLNDKSLILFSEYNLLNLSNLILPKVPRAKKLFKYFDLIDGATPKFLLLKINLRLFAKYNKLMVLMLEPKLLKSIKSRNYSLIGSIRSRQSELYNHEFENRNNAIQTYKSYLLDCISILQNNDSEIDRYNAELNSYYTRLNQHKLRLIENIKLLQEQLSSLNNQRPLQVGEIIDLNYASIYYDILVKLGKAVTRDQLYNINLIPQMVKIHAEELEARKSKDEAEYDRILNLLSVKYGVTNSLFELNIPRYPKLKPVSKIDLKIEQDQLNEMAIRLRAAENKIKSKIS